MGEGQSGGGGAPYDEARAWQDNYDGMFARWLEADTERLEWKRRAEDAERLVRILREDLAARVAPPGASADE